MLPGIINGGIFVVCIADSCSFVLKVITSCKRISNCNLWIFSENYFETVNKAVRSPVVVLIVHLKFRLSIMVECLKINQFLRARFDFGVNKLRGEERQRYKRGAGIVKGVERKRRGRRKEGRKEGGVGKEM